MFHSDQHGWDCNIFGCSIVTHDNVLDVLDCVVSNNQHCCACELSVAGFGDKSAGTTHCQDNHRKT